MDIKEFFLETIQRFTQLSSTTLVGIDYSDLNALLLILAFSLLVAFLVYKVKKARKIIEIENKNQSKIIEKTESH